MKKEDIEYLMKRSKFTCEQAANDLERYLLREEPPAVGAVAKAVYVLKQLAGEFDKNIDVEDKVQLYTEHRDGKPASYRYGEPWVATMLFIEGGFATPEEAMRDWFDKCVGGIN